MDIKEVLAKEAQFMGRPNEYINAHETTFSGEDGVEHTVTFLTYRTLPREGEEFRDEIMAMVGQQARFAVYVDGKPNTGGIIG